MPPRDTQAAGNPELQIGFPEAPKTLPSSELAKMFEGQEVKEASASAERLVDQSVADELQEISAVDELVGPETEPDSASEVAELHADTDRVVSQIHQRAAEAKKSVAEALNSLDTTEADAGFLEMHAQMVAEETPKTLRSPVGVGQPKPPTPKAEVPVQPSIEHASAVRTSLAAEWNQIREAYPKLEQGPRDPDLVFSLARQFEADPTFRAVRNEVALAYLRTHGDAQFQRDYTGEMDEKGWLIPRRPDVPPAAVTGYDIGDSHYEITRLALAKYLKNQLDAGEPTAQTLRSASATEASAPATQEEPIPPTVKEAGQEAKAEAKEAAPLNQYIADFDALLDQYNAILAEGGDAVKEKMKKPILSLVFASHPDKHLGDPRIKALQDLSGFLSRLKKASGEVDLPKRASDFEIVRQEWAAWKEKTAASELTVEKVDPNMVEHAGVDLAKAAVEGAGNFTADQLIAVSDLIKKCGALEQQGAATPMTTFLALTFEKYRANPIGLLESLKEFASQFPQAGIDRAVVDQLLEGKGKEVVERVGELARDVSDLMRSLLANGGVTHEQMLRAYDRVASEFHLGGSRAAVDDADWLTLGVAFKSLSAVMNPTNSPRDRLEIIDGFIGQFPEAAQEYGMTKAEVAQKIAEIDAKTAASEKPSEKVQEGENDKNIEGEGGRQEVIAAAVISAAESGIDSKDAQEIEAHQRKIKKLGEESDLAFAAGDETRLKLSIGGLEAEFKKQHNVRQRQLDALLRVPKEAQTEAMKARIEELMCANTIDEQALERRRKQFELLELKREKSDVDAEVVALQQELKKYEGAQEHNLLAKNAEEGRVLAIPGSDEKKRLEGRLAELLHHQEALGKKIGETEKAIEEIEDLIGRLGRVMQNAKGEQGRHKEKKAAGGLAGEDFEPMVGGGIPSAEGGPKGRTVDDYIRIIGQASVAPTEAIVNLANKVLNVNVTKAS